MMPTEVIYQTEIEDEIERIKAYPDYALPGELEQLEEILDEWEDPAREELFQLVDVDVPQEERPCGEFNQIVTFGGKRYRVSYYENEEPVAC